MADTIKDTTINLPVVDESDYNTGAAPVDSGEFMEVPEGQQGNLPFN